MASIPDDSASDNDNERPVREKLKKASLGSLQGVHSEGVVDPEELSEALTSRTDTQPETCKGFPSDIAVTEEGVSATDGRLLPDNRLGEEHETTDSSLQEAQSEVTTQPDHDDKSAAVEGSTVTTTREQGITDVSESTKPDPLPEYQVDAVEQEASKLDDLKASQDAPSPNDAAMQDSQQGRKLPRKKRSRDQLDADDGKGEVKGGATVREASESRRKVSSDAEGCAQAANRVSRTLRDEPEKKRHRDSSQEASSAPVEDERKQISSSMSAFANTSTISRFRLQSVDEPTEPTSKSAITGFSDDLPQTSASAFKASGFGALAGSTTSAFGVIGTSSSGASAFGGFGGSQYADGGSGGKEDASVSGTASGFGKLKSSGDSIFGSGGSGFGGLASGLRTGLGGSGPSFFGSRTGPSITGLRGKSSRAFGAPEGDDTNDGEEDEEGDEDDDADGSVAEQRRHASEDRRAPEVETGEEGEETIFSGQAKLYHLVRGDTPADSGWKERGAGVLKVKVRVAPAEESLEPTEDDGDEVSPDTAVTESVHRTARLLMRASGVYRVVLNSPIYKGMNLRTPAGSVPSLEKPSKQLMLTIIEDGKPVMMQVKFRDPANALDLYRSVAEIEGHL